MSLFELQQLHREGKTNKADYIAAMARLHANLFEYAAFIPHTDIRAINIVDGQVIFTLKGTGADILMVCDPADQRMAPLEILNFGSYEPGDFEVVLRLLEGSSTILDIGANIGWYSLQLAATFPQASIHAFEPIPQTYAYLARNVELNHAPGVTTYNMGFWNIADTLTFYYYPEGSGNASAANLSDRPSVREVHCPVGRLDDFVADHDLHVDFIKCDVEGAEWRVFEGAVQTLRRSQPMIYTEMLRKWSAKFGYHPNQMITFFADLGYRCFIARHGSLYELFSMDESTLETNFFFLHGQRHQRQLATLTRS